MATTFTTRTALSALHGLPKGRCAPTQMRSPRTILLTPAEVHRHKACKAQPRSDSLFWHLWEQNVDVAEKALETGFIQGIKAGTLNPVTYGRYNVSDAYYCYHGAEDYAIAAGRAHDPTLQAYLQLKHAAYARFNATLPGTWRLKDARGIVPSAACAAYSDFERRLAREEDPVYALVGMLPCEALWAWLGGRLSPPRGDNVYRGWVEANRDAGGAFAVGNFLDDFQARGGDLDWHKAQRLYRQAMTYEWHNFETA